MNARRIVRFLTVGIAGVAIMLTGLWGTLAIWFRLAAVPPSREILAGGFLLLAIAAMLGLALRRWRVVIFYWTVFLILVTSWLTLTPSNNRDWADDVALTATGTLEGNRLVVRNVRNFRWRTDTDFTTRWETRSYDLNGLEEVDLIMSYWAGESIAHTILSFGFSDGQRLAFSIEIRNEKAQSYSPLAGFFRAYELVFIAADERDVLGVRTNVRGEDVRIYRLRMKPEQARALLLEYIGEANELAREPRFYNSLTSNCSTQVFGMVRAVHRSLPWDYRMVVNGYSPDLVYELGGLDNNMSFAALREKSHIRGKASSTDPDFSTKIRKGIPAPLKQTDGIP
jgi:hypothetical protein